MFAVSPPSFSVRPVPARLAADAEDDNVGLPSGGDGSGDAGGPEGKTPVPATALTSAGQEPPDRLGQGQRPVGVLGGLLHVRVRLRHSAFIRAKPSAGTAPGLRPGIGNLPMLPAIRSTLSAAG